MAAAVKAEFGRGLQMDFHLLQRAPVRIEHTSGPDLQLYKPIETIEIAENGTRVQCHENVYKSRKYRFRALGREQSPWVGRKLTIELYRCDDGERVSNGCCGEPGYAPIRDDRGGPCDALVSEIDRFGETDPFQLNACRHCHRNAWLQFRLTDLETGGHPAGLVRIIVRSRPPTAAALAAAAARPPSFPTFFPLDIDPARRRAPFPLGLPLGRRAFSPDERSERRPAEPKRARRADAGAPPAQPFDRCMGEAGPSHDFFESAASALRALFNPATPDSNSPRSLDGPSLTSSHGSVASLASSQGSSPFASRGLPSACSSAKEPAPSSGPPASVELVARMESRILGILVEGEARHWQRGGKPQDGPGPPALAPDAEAPALTLPKADPLEQLFARFTVLSLDCRPRRASYGDAAGPPDAAPALPPGAGFSFASVRPPYRLTPEEAADFLRQVADAEAAGAGCALGVLLGDPRVLGTALFRTVAGWSRVQRLLETVQIAVARRRPASPGYFVPPAVDGIVCSLATALLSSPTRYDFIEDAVRACENVWNFVIVCTSDYTLISPDLMYITLDEALALHQKALAIADAAVERARAKSGGEALQRAELAWAEARIRLAITLRQYGYMRRSLECQFEAWDVLLRLQVFPHRLEAECIRELVELHVLLERIDLARHFAEKLYWFEETTADLHFRSTCMQTLGFLNWHEGHADESADFYRRGCAIMEELVRATNGNPHYMLHASRVYKASFVSEATNGSLVSALKQAQLGLELQAAVAGLNSPEFDELCWMGAIVWRPDGFRLSHVIKIFRGLFAFIEWMNRIMRDAPPSARSGHMLFHIGNVYLLDGQYEEALEMYCRAAAHYRSTPELAAVFGDDHPRIRALHRAAAAAAARLDPATAALAAEAAAVEHAPPAARWRPASDALQSAWVEGPEAPPGCDLALFAALKHSYSSDSWHQIAFWAARCPLPASSLPASA